MKNRKIALLFIVGLITLNSISCNDSISDQQTEHMGILDNYANFDVDVSTTPITIPEIAKSSYTSPSSNYGITSFIDFKINDDNTVDVLWLDNNRSKHLSRISLNDKKLVENIDMNSKVNLTGKVLGFEKLDKDEFVIGYTKDNSHGDENAEAWYTAFNKSGELYSTRIFGEIDLNENGSKGMPGQAGSAVIRYNPTDDVLNVYVAHTQMWSDGVRHQAGWIGFLNGETGELITDSNDKFIGNGWFYSHNFDQRSILSSSGDFYVLAHGDAYPRALGLAKFDHESGKISALQYYKLKYGTTGQNRTDSHTGDLVELSNDNVAIVFSTSEDRSQRDLRVTVVGSMKSSASDDDPVVLNEKWITNNKNDYVGWGSKIAQYGDYILVGWNQFDNDKSGTGSYFALLNLEGELVSDTEMLEENCFYPTQSILTTSDGNYLVWVSAHGESKLRVHMLKVV